MSFAWLGFSQGAQQLLAAGFRIESGAEEFPLSYFKDIAAVIYYLKAISWQIYGFSLKEYREPLQQLHDHIQCSGDFAVAPHRFWLRART